MSKASEPRIMNPRRSGKYPEESPCPPTNPPTTPAQPFRYLSLPPEIRTMILHLTLRAPSRLQQQPTPRKATRGADGLRFPTPLLATNRQTRDEGLAILLRKNVLGIDLIPGDVSLPPWIKYPGHHLCCVRNVDLHLFPRKCARFAVNGTTIPLVARSLRCCENLENVKITLFHNSGSYIHDAGSYIHDSRSSVHDAGLRSVAHIHSLARWFGGGGAKLEIWLCDTKGNEGDEVWSSWDCASKPLGSAPMVKVARYQMSEEGTRGWVFEAEGLRAAGFTDLRGPM